MDYTLNFYSFIQTIMFCQRRYVFVDEEGIYYLWKFRFFKYRAGLEIVPFKMKDGIFVEMQTDKAKELIEYLKPKLLNKTAQQIQTFCEDLTFLKLDVPKSIEEKFGEKFCNFLYDRDKEFIYQDPNAKHWIIDFEKIRNNEPDFLKVPDLFPFMITELGVTLKEDGELFKDGKKITIERFWEIVKEYKSSLIPFIKSKDKILRKIEKDLKRRYDETLRQLENNKKISDFEIEPKIEILDILLSDEPLHTINYGRSMSEVDELWSLGLFGIDLKVSWLCRFQLEALGLRSIQKTSCKSHPLAFKRNSKL